MPDHLEVVLFIHSDFLFLEKRFLKISREVFFPEFIEVLWSELPNLDQKIKDFSIITM